jgi:hypothetical protein
LPQGDSPSLLNGSYTITADITVPEGGAEGMILPGLRGLIWIKSMITDIN